MPPLEAWQKVLVGESFMGTIYGGLSCVDCHSGDSTPQTFETAHVGITADPASGSAASCGICHGSVGTKHQTSLHGSLEGYKQTIRTRSGQATLSPELNAMFDAKCATCHTSCGQCHISRPDAVGGGFNAGHVFIEKPSMTLNCTACHGSRIGEEFRGLHEGIPADTHYNRGMQCTACHNADEIHFAGGSAANRYSIAEAPRCEDCHEVGAENAYHLQHKDDMSCQVCHSQEYKNCYNCHVGTEESGIQQPSELDFKIGKNPLKSARRPYGYVLLRHIPIAPDSYEEWAPGQLTNYEALPTWKMTTPHNIQKNTPQTANCTSSCHNNTELFLTRDDILKLSPQEQAANRDVVVDKVPE